MELALLITLISEVQHVFRTKALFMTREEYELQNITVHHHGDSSSVPCNNYRAKLGSEGSINELTLAKMILRDASIFSTEE